MPKPSIDLGALQQTLTNARRQHGNNSKALTKAQEAASRSKKALDDAQQALDAGSRSVLANG